MTERSTASADQGTILRGLASKRRISVGSEIYNQLVETLYLEAAVLDQRRFDDWILMLAQDLVYTAPIRVTRTGANRDRDVARTMFHFDDTYDSLSMRMGRLSKSAWAEDPPSRTRRFVTNVLAAELDNPDEYEVVSYLYLTRSRGSDPHVETITAERRDMWRFAEGQFKLFRREIIVDASVLAMSNFAVFL